MIPPKSGERLTAHEVQCPACDLTQSVWLGEHIPTDASESPEWWLVKCTGCGYRLKPDPDDFT